MTSASGGYPPPTTTSPPGTSPPTSELAKEEASGVAESAKHASGQVAATATEQAKEVAAEATQQARNLIEEGQDQLREQARSGQQKAAEKLDVVADELRDMAQKSDQPGLASDLAMQAADKVHNVASWLQDREPGDLLVEVRNWARRRPGAFLAGAAIAGVLAGRLTRGAVAAQNEPSNGDGAAQPSVRPQPSTSHTASPPNYPPPAGYRPGEAPNVPAPGNGPGGRVER